MLGILSLIPVSKKGTNYVEKLKRTKKKLKQDHYFVNLKQRPIPDLLRSYGLTRNVRSEGLNAVQGALSGPEECSVQAKRIEHCSIKKPLSEAYKVSAFFCPFGAKRSINQLA